MTTHHTHTLAAMMAATALAACSTEVELCYEDMHPHAATVAYGFGFDGNISEPDTMLVIANRVVARRVSAMAVSPATGQGRFVVGEVPTVSDAATDETAPTDDPTTDETDGNGASDGQNEPSGNNGTATDETAENGAPTTMTRQAGSTTQQQDRQFRLPVGTYRFMAINIDSAEFDYGNVGVFLDGNGELPMSRIYVEYRVYARTNEELRSPLLDWQDYNPYAGYMQPDIMPLLVDTMGTDLRRGQRTTIAFHPQPLTQNIDIYLNVTKRASNQRFRIDSVYAELSGIPRRIYVASGNLDINQTAKMMFKMHPVNSQGAHIADSEGNTGTVRCHANIDVTGVVPAQNSTLATGPGIVQVMIFVSSANASDPNGERTRKKIQGKINIYNTLSQARLTEYVEDGRYVRRRTSHGTITIQAPVEINGQSIVESSDNDYGVDAWIACDEIDVEI